MPAFDRRAFLTVLVSPALPTTKGTAALDLTYAAHRLRWPGGDTRAAIGRTGVRRDKREGDGASPQGKFPLQFALYRPDRIPPPVSSVSGGGLPLAALAPDQGWVDAPADRNYNRRVTLPYPASAERLWRSDDLYDLIVVIGYNTDPIVPGLGSAIFLHVARPDFSGTDGCVAIARPVLMALVPLLGPGSTMTIRP